MKKTLFFLFSIMISSIIFAQLKSQDAILAKMPSCLRLDSSNHSLIVKIGYTFKRTGPRSGQIIQTSTSRKKVEVSCACGAGSTGSCDLSTEIISGGGFIVVCSGNCSGGCGGSVTPIPTPGKDKTKYQKYEIGKWTLNIYQ